MPRNPAGTGSNGHCPRSALGEGAAGTSSSLSCSPGKRLFAQDAAARLVIYFHFPKAGLSWLLCPLSFAVVMACEGHSVTWNNLIFFFFNQFITCNDLVADLLSQQNGQVEGQECL